MDNKNIDKSGNKTPSYTREAINRYNSKFDRITVNFPVGTKERIKELTGKTAGGFAVESVLLRLDEIEKTTAGSASDDQEKTPAPSQD